MRTLRICLVIAPLVAVTGCASKAERTAAVETKARPTPVKTIRVEESDWPSFYDAVGTVRARSSAQVASRVMSYVRQVDVTVGDRVRQGQRLIVLDARDLESRGRQAGAARAEAGTAAAEADSAVESARANLELAEVTFRRMKDLFDKTSISNQEFDEASARLRMARANLEMAVSRRKQVDSKIVQAEEEVTAARIQSGYSILTAPLSGVVTEKTVEPGNLAVPGAPLLTIDQQDGYRFHAQVEESNIGTVRRREPVTVELDSLDRALHGTVSEISPVADPAAHSFLVKIDLPAAADLRSGLFGRARFPGASRRLLAAPAQAVAQRGQTRWVFVVDAGAARSRLVTLGSRYENQIEILSGLSAGDQVISPAPPNLSDGDPVEVLR